MILYYQSLYHEVMFEFSSRVQVRRCTMDLFHFHISENETMTGDIHEMYLPIIKL